MLLLRLALACLMPGVIGSATLFFYHYQMGLAALERDTLQTSRALSYGVDAYLMRVQTAAQVLATSEFLAKHDLAGFRGLANEVLKATSVGTSVALSDANGQLILTTLLPANVPQPLSRNEEQIKRLFSTGKPFVSDVFISKVTNEPTLALYVPVWSADKVTYALGIGIAPQQLARILQDQRLPPDWIGAIVDSSGTLASRTLAPERFVGQKASASLLNAMQRSDEGTFEGTSLDGIATFTFFSRSPKTKWNVAIGVPRASLLSPLVHDAIIFGLGIVVLFGIGLGTAWLMGGRIAASVRALTGPAAALASGDPVVVPEVHFGEAAEVAQAMAQAALLLKRRDENLAQGAHALRLSEEQMRGIFESATDAIMTADHTQTVVKANAAAAAMFLCTIDEMIGSPLERFIPERHRARHRRDVQAFGDSEGSARHMGGARDVMGLRVDGQEFPIDAAISHLQVDGKRLYTAILRDITERRRAEQALLDSRADLQRLIQAQDSVQESERKRIARELHDDLQQRITAIKMNISAAGERMMVAKGEAQALLAEADKLAVEAIVSTRRIVHDLRPPELDDLGLVDALQAMSRQFSQRTGIDCDVETDEGAANALAAWPELSSCLFRVAQESLNNAFKHARASTVTIKLAFSNGRIALRITDNGQGMSAHERNKSGSFGMLGMQERVRAIGGALRVESQPGAGTMIEAVVDVELRNEA